jgi:hypothetical protein
MKFKRSNKNEIDTEKTEPVKRQTPLSAGGVLLSEVLKLR